MNIMVFCFSKNGDSNVKKYEQQGIHASTDANRNFNNINLNSTTMPHGEGFTNESWHGINMEQHKVSMWI